MKLRIRVKIGRCPSPQTSVTHTFSYAGPEANREPITVTLPAGHWDAVLEAMAWKLPRYDDHGPEAQHSARCFHAQQAIRRALRGNEA